MSEAIDRLSRRAAQVLADNPRHLRTYTDEKASAVVSAVLRGLVAADPAAYGHLKAAAERGILDMERVDKMATAPSHEVGFTVAELAVFAAVCGYRLEFVLSPKKPAEGQSPVGPFAVS